MRTVVGLLALALWLGVAEGGEPGLKKADPPPAMPEAEAKAAPQAEPKAAPEAEPKAEPKEAPKVEPKAQPKESAKAEPKEAPKTEPKQPEPAPGPTPPFTGEVTGERVYIRAGDGINYTVLSVAGRGDRVEVKGKRYEWYQIPVPRSCTVWLRNDMLTVEADGKQGTLVKDRVNVRARPGLTSDVLGQVALGTKVAVVDRDGDWVGISPPEAASAWIHSQHVRKIGDAATLPPPPAKETPTAKPPLAGGAATAALRKAQELYQAELGKPAAQRNFDQVLAAYQQVASQADDPGAAAAAERARQRLLKIVDLHNSLRAATEPIEQFDKKYKDLEQEYRKRAEEAGQGKPE